MLLTFVFCLCVWQLQHSCQCESSQLQILSSNRSQICETLLKVFLLSLSIMHRSCAKRVEYVNGTSFELWRWIRVLQRISRWVKFTSWIFSFPPRFLLYSVIVFYVSLLQLIIVIVSHCQILPKWIQSPWIPELFYTIPEMPVHVAKKKKKKARLQNVLLTHFIFIFHSVVQTCSAAVATFINIWCPSPRLLLHICMHLSRCPVL